jgi:hypothetical protein
LTTLYLFPNGKKERVGGGERGREREERRKWEIVCKREATQRSGRGRAGIEG